MTSGLVVGSRRIIVPVSIRGGRDEWQTLPFVLDTGFTGNLALTDDYIQRLGLMLDTMRRVTPATGQTIQVLSGLVETRWHNTTRQVQAIQTGNQPLLGMEFLWNHRITIDAVPNGPVTITPIGG